MAEARLRHDWTRTAELLAMIHNTAFGCSKALDPADFLPAALRPPAGPEPEARGEPSAADAAANWSAVKGLVTAGRFG